MENRRLLSRSLFGLCQFVAGALLVAMVPAGCGGATPQGGTAGAETDAQGSKAAEPTWADLDSPEALQAYVHAA
ncbi:MAG: hypothetical protein KC416_13800, partial [Myxococcales bacterium]|nr:hypothetical protein [Myxococcales bacterium]